MSGVYCLSSKVDITFFPKKVRHERDTSDTSPTQMKNFDFDNNTSKKIFSHPYIYYMASERL